MADELIFGCEEAKWLRRIASYYEVTKGLLIFGEEVDPQNNTLVQSVNELRNSFDHLMRVVSNKSGQRKADDGEKYVEAILGNEITALRIEKDVTVQSEENLLKYGQVTGGLKQLFKAIISGKSALVEHHVRLKRSRRREVIVRVVETMAVGAGVGILVYLLT